MAVTPNARWDNSGTVIPGGDAEYVVAEQPIAEYDNWFNYNIVADIQAVIDDVINKFNANTILKADSDNTPAALVVAEQTIVGRKTGNSIAALTDAEVLAIIGVEPGATADQTDTEIRDAVEAAADSNTFTDNDHTKLNGIETAATTDQSDAEIRTAVEAATDSNVFTDADHTKLNGIDAGADVTGSNPPQNHGSRHVADGADPIDGLAATISASDTLIFSNDTERTCNNVTPVQKIKSIIGTLLSGTVRVKWQTHGTGGNDSYTRLYIGGVDVTGRIDEPSTTYVDYSYDKDIEIGDEIALYGAGSGGNTAYYRNFRIYGTQTALTIQSNDP